MENEGDSTGLQFTMIDTHCHLESEEFDDSRLQVIARAVSAGIGMINSAVTPDSWNRSLLLSGQHKTVFMVAGLDPAQYSLVDRAASWIRNHLGDLVGLGEVGLDHYLVRDHTQRGLQEEAFREMIRLANETNLPLQVHSRSAGRRALEVLRSACATNVQMHAFDGRASLARDASSDLGYYFSIPTSVVRSPQKRKLVKAVSIERLLIETDSPVLGPNREQINEPANLPIALREVAAILGRNEEEMLEIILENTLRLYTRVRDRH